MVSDSKQFRFFFKVSLVAIVRQSGLEGLVVSSCLVGVAFCVTDVLVSRLILKARIGVAKRMANRDSLIKVGFVVR